MITDLLNHFMDYDLIDLVVSNLENGLLGCFLNEFVVDIRKEVTNSRFSESKIVDWLVSVGTDRAYLSVTIE